MAKKPKCLKIAELERQLLIKKKRSGRANASRKEVKWFNSRLCPGNTHYDLNTEAFNYYIGGADSGGKLLFGALIVSLIAYGALTIIDSQNNTGIKNQINQIRNQRLGNSQTTIRDKIKTNRANRQAIMQSNREVSEGWTKEPETNVEGLDYDPIIERFDEQK